MLEGPPWVRQVAAVAEEFHDEPEAQEVIRAAARLAVDHAPGCDVAAISLVRREGQVETLASTAVVGAVGDMLQFALGQGPGLDARWDERIVHSGDLPHEPRWQAWCTRMSRDYDHASVLCIPLFAHDDHVAILSLYSRAAHALDVVWDGLLGRLTTGAEPSLG